jgi:phosphatidylinositol glycan class A protein
LAKYGSYGYEIGRLSVVSTCVGGIPEVLPEELIHFAEPTPECELANLRSHRREAVSALIEALHEAIRDRTAGRGMSAEERHRAVTEMYSWADVVERTLVVYESAVGEPAVSWTDRLLRYGKLVIGT